LLHPEVSIMSRILVLALVAGLVACASGGRRSGARETDRITFQEIEVLQVATAYEVVERLRPEFLRTRGATSVSNPVPQEAVVYLDGLRQGGLDALRRISKESLREIRYIDSRDATTQYGTGHRGGAILVVTR
jgi:hypothetical protein